MATPPRRMDLPVPRLCSSPIRRRALPALRGWWAVGWASRPLLRRSRRPRPSAVSGAPGRRGSPSGLGQALPLAVRYPGGLLRSRRRALSCLPSVKGGNLFRRAMVMEGCPLVRVKSMCCTMGQMVFPMLMIRCSGPSYPDRRGDRSRGADASRGAARYRGPSVKRSQPRRRQPLSHATPAADRSIQREIAPCGSSPSPAA